MGIISLQEKTKLGELLSFNNIDLGGMIPIATVAVGAGGQSTVSFTSIPQVYEHLQIRGIVRGGSEVAVTAAFNGSTGNGHTLYGNGTIVGSFVESGVIPISVTPNSGNNSAIFGAFVCDILDYSNTNKNKTTRSIHGTEKDSSGNAYVMFSSGLWASTAAVSSITLTLGGGASFVQYSSFALYGIKRAGA
jgi:hypothetical protein